jgi:Protein of unknown function (DUF3604)
MRTRLVASFGAGHLPQRQPEHRWSAPLADFGPGRPKIFGWEQASSGYAAVWATENTREALWDAMQRKEVYGTTGPRMIVRFFGGWDLEAKDAQNRLPHRIGYEKGVPMGGDLHAAPAGKAPTFLVAALKDPIGANLDRIQVIKGWLDQTGDVQEQIYDVVWSGDRGPSDSDSVYRFSSLVGLICHSDPLMRRSMTVLSPSPQGFSPMPGMCDIQSSLMPRGGACCTYLTVPVRLAGVTSPAQDSGSYAAVEPVEGLTAHGISGYTAGMAEGPLPCWNA